MSGKAASVAELRQADLRSTNRPRAAFVLDRQGALRWESRGLQTLVSNHCDPADELAVFLINALADTLEAIALKDALRRSIVD